MGSHMDEWGSETFPCPRCHKLRLDKCHNDDNTRRLTVEDVACERGADTNWAFGSDLHRDSDV
jgi:hypothetical protein